MELKVGDKIQLRGKTLLGKNRIREHGDIWIIIKGPALVDRAYIRAGQFLIQPMPNSLDTRWIMPGNDRDFEIVDKVA